MVKWAGVGMNRLRLGMWAWGLVTAGLAGASLALVIWAGLHTDEAGNLAAKGWLSGMYKVISDNNSLVAGVLGFSGLAWAHFFQESGRGK